MPLQGRDLRMNMMIKQGEASGTFPCMCPFNARLVPVPGNKRKPGDKSEAALCSQRAPENRLKISKGSQSFFIFHSR
jgi:hypothetical protein